MAGKVILAGGSGFIGATLKNELKKKGYDPILLSRKEGPNTVVWDGETLGSWVDSLSGAAAVINLSGAPITLPWNKENRKKIRESRQKSTRIIGEALSKVDSPPPVWVNASAMGIYGDRGDEVLTERSDIGPADHFLVSTCKEWESAAAESCPSHVRLALIRTGFVLGNEGGAYPILRKLTKAFLGGKVGNGQQFVSWIHVEDMASLYVRVMEGAQATIFNGTAPNPVRNEELMGALRKSLGRPWAPPAPGFAMKLLQSFGGPDASLVLEGQKVLPEAALAEGFKFKFETIESALRDLKSE